MGFLSYLPNQCNHAIISMSHQVAGDFQMGDQSWKTQDAYGYMEKDGCTFLRGPKNRATSSLAGSSYSLFGVSI